jgi:predicted nucleotidyltransferase/HEPN domain-containing protein
MISGDSPAMRTELTLPSGKQRELERVVQILFEEFADANSQATGDRMLGRILKVILYGSYARGGWVDEPHTAKGYQSDFDLLVIVNQKELTDRVAFWEKADERFERERTILQLLKTPVNFIVHTLQEVNDGLAHGRYFFMDIAQDGVALYQSDDSELHQPKPKTPDQALALAKEYFDEWMPAAAGILQTAAFSREQGRLKDAAFLMHQATERLYHCVLLVLTSYTPHVHNLGFLRTQAERSAPRLFSAWPRTTAKERARFEKLKDAYVKARYSKHYRISEEELLWLSAQVEELGRLVHSVCTDRIGELEIAASPRRPTADAAPR